MRPQSARHLGQVRVLGEPRPGCAARVARDVFGRACREDAPAVWAAARSHVAEVVGGGEQVPCQAPAGPALDPCRGSAGLSCRAAATAVTPQTVSLSQSSRQAAGQVDSFTTTVCDGTWTNTCCPFDPGGEVERHARVAEQPAV